MADAIGRILQHGVEIFNQAAAGAKVLNRRYKSVYGAVFADVRANKKALPD
jgi:hypothetical protein